MERVHERKWHKLHTDRTLFRSAVWKLQFLQTGKLDLAQLPSDTYVGLLITNVGDSLWSLHLVPIFRL